MIFTFCKLPYYALPKQLASKGILRSKYFFNFDVHSIEENGLPYEAPTGA
jgi:hypothetical protein